MFFLSKNKGRTICIAISCIIATPNPPLMDQKLCGFELFSPICGLLKLFFILVSFFQYLRVLFTFYYIALIHAQLPIKCRHSRVLGVGQLPPTTIK